MKSIHLLPLFLMAALQVACAISPHNSKNSVDAIESERLSPFESSQYSINVGDRLAISVFQEKDLTGEFVVESDGKINFPLLGRIPVAGGTSSLLEKRIALGLSEGYLVSPDVRITISGYKPIFVGGEVKKAGEYPFKPGLTAQQAVTLAGGITRFAAEKYYIQRNGTSPDQRFRAFPDTFVYPGDIVIIEERLF